MSPSDELAQRHRQAWDLIPWVVNGRATADERRVVEEHVAACGDCREELGFQRQLHQAMTRDGEVAVDPAPALRRLLRRIDIEDAVAPPPAAVRRPRHPVLLRGLLAAVVVEAVGIAALSATLWSRSAAPAGAAPNPTATYRTLSAPAVPAPAATIRAVLNSTMRLEGMQALLAQTRLQIVGGPTEAGVYSLAPLSAADAAYTGQALAQLRANPDVRFAEPLAPTPPPAPP